MQVFRGEKEGIILGLAKKLLLFRIGIRRSMEVKNMLFTIYGQDLSGIYGGCDIWECLSEVNY